MVRAVSPDRPSWDLNWCLSGRRCPCALLLGACSPLPLDYFSTPASRLRVNSLFAHLVFLTYFPGRTDSGPTNAGATLKALMPGRPAEPPESLCDSIPRTVCELCHIDQLFDVFMFLHIINLDSTFKQP